MPAIPEQRKRAVLTRLASVLASWLLLLTASAMLMARSGIRINLSGSASIGLYRLIPGEFSRGSLVAGAVDCRTQADRDRAGGLAVPRCSFHPDLNVPGFAVRCTNPARRLMNGE